MLASADSLTWRSCVDGALPGALNMARDHALALSLAPDSATLRLYRWSRPTLSLGRNEPTRGRYQPETIRRKGVDVVRRPTGGRAVLHWSEITYAVVVPARALGGPRAVYRWINGRIAEALAMLGVEAEIAPDPTKTLLLSAGPCFTAPAAGEVTAGGRKLVGSAQLRVGDSLLQHGSILVADDQERLASLLGLPTGGGDRPATMSDLLGRTPHAGELERVLMEAFGLGAGCEGDVHSTSPKERELEGMYESEAWTWRR